MASGVRSRFASPIAAMALELPPTVARNVAAMGETGAAWLAQLPTLVNELQLRWGVTVGETMPNATEAYVAAADVVAG